MGDGIWIFVEIAKGFADDEFIEGGFFYVFEELYSEVNRVLNIAGFHENVDDAAVNIFDDGCIVAAFEDDSHGFAF